MWRNQTARTINKAATAINLVKSVYGASDEQAQAVYNALKSESTDDEIIKALSDYSKTVQKGETRAVQDNLFNHSAYAQRMAADPPFWLRYGSGTAAAIEQGRETGALLIMKIIYVITLLV